MEGAVAAHLGDSPVDIVGFSQGARLALELACTYPDRVDRLVLLGIGANLFSNDDSFATTLSAVLDGSRSPATPPEHHFLQLASAEDQDPLALAAFLRRPRPPELTEARVSEISHPTLLIVGTADFVWPPDDLTAAMPHAKLVPLNGVDHFATPKNFDCISAALEFLDA